MAQSQNSQKFLNTYNGSKFWLFPITKNCTPIVGAITTKTNWETDRTQAEIDLMNTLGWTTNGASRRWKQTRSNYMHFHSRQICILFIRYVFNISPQGVTIDFHTPSDVSMGGGEYSHIPLLPLMCGYVLTSGKI